MAPDVVRRGGEVLDCRLGVRRGLPARLDFSPSGEDDPPMNERPSAGSGVVGYLLVLVGVAGFVLSCFLPYTRFFDQVSVSYYQLVTGSWGGTLEDVGGLLLLFGGTTTVAWVALAGLRHGQHERRRTPSTLLAVTIAWSLSWIGLLLSLSGPFEHEVGYWSMLVSVGVVIVGSVVAWVSGRRTAHGLDSGAGPEPPTEVPVS